MIFAPVGENSSEAFYADYRALNVFFTDKLNEYFKPAPFIAIVCVRHQLRDNELQRRQADCLETLRCRGFISADARPLVQTEAVPERHNSRIFE